MHWVLPIFNVMWFVLKILVLTSVWVSVEHNYEFFFIRTMCNVLGVTSRFGCVMIRYIIYFWTYLSCLVIMIFAYSLIGRINLSETLSQISHGTNNVLFETSADGKKLEWMFLVIMSRHLVRLRIASLHRAGVQTFEFVKRFSLLGLMVEGYLCGFWRVVYCSCFFIDFLEFLKLLCRICRAVNDGYEYRYKNFFKTCLLGLGACWAYMFLYLLPRLFIYQLFYYEDNEKAGVIPLFLFRVSFLAFIVLTAIDFPFVWSYPYISIDTIDEIVNLGEHPPKGPVVIPLINVPDFSERTVRKPVPNTRSTNVQSDEKTVDEKREQKAAIRQMIRCIITLKKKAKRIREKRNKQAEPTIKEIPCNDKKD